MEQFSHEGRSTYHEEMFDMALNRRAESRARGAVEDGGQEGRVTRSVERRPCMDGSCRQAWRCIIYFRDGPNIDAVR